MTAVMRGATLALLLATGPVAASEVPPACAAISNTNLPPALAGWAATAVPLTAGRTAATAPPMGMGMPHAVRLSPAPDVELPSPPGQARTPEAAHAGLLKLTLPRAGIWRVSASEPVWIDVIGPDGPVASSGHGRMAPCTSIRKVVEFPLPAGGHVVQLSGNPGPDLMVMLSPKP